MLLTPMFFIKIHISCT